MMPLLQYSPNSHIIVSHDDVHQRKETNILTLILTKQWERCRCLIAEDPFHAVSPSTPSSCRCDKPHTPLSLAIMMKAPLYLIETLIYASPFSLIEQDCLGRYPLHVACEHAAHPRIIQKIALMNEYILMAKDKMGRTPLISACENYIMNSDAEMNDDLDASENLLEVIEIILSINPQCVIEEDNNGICCIEHALYSDSSISCIEKLQKASEKQRKLMAGEIICEGQYST